MVERQRNSGRRDSIDARKDEGSNKEDISRRLSSRQFSEVESKKSGSRNSKSQLMNLEKVLSPRSKVASAIANRKGISVSGPTWEATGLGQVGSA